MAVRLLPKPSDTMDLRMMRMFGNATRLDPAILRLRSFWFDPQEDETTGGVGHKGGSFLDIRHEPLLFENEVVGRQQDHDSLRIPLVDVQQRQKDAWPRLPVAGLDDDGTWWAIIEFLPRIIKVRTGHYGQETLRRDDPFSPAKRVPEH
jgi:hypothetical protein